MLNDRMRAIAREEIEAAAAPPAQGAAATQEIADLHEHLHRAMTLIDGLTKRVTALEGAPSAVAQVEAAERKGATMRAPGRQTASAARRSATTGKDKPA